MKLHFLFPEIGKHEESSGLFIIRKGYILEFNTRILYIKKQPESPGWLELRILGFGLGLGLGSWFDEQF